MIATPHMAFAALFMIEIGLSILSGSFDRAYPLFVVCNSKDLFLKSDKGGAIYLLTSNAFDYDLGMRGITRQEWLSNPYDAQL